MSHTFQRALQAVSWVGLAFSLLTLIFSAPHLFAQGGGTSRVLGNLAQYAWTVALLLAAFTWTRTIGARALVGAGLAGFFGVASLAVLLGKPLVDRLGPDNLFVPLLFAPISEEMLKLLPVALFLLLAVRNRRWRPSLSDAVLFGVTVGSGFALYENILYARGTDGGWFTTMPLSPLLPFLSLRDSMLVGGHAVYTGLASLRLAITVLYGNRFRFARLALPLALGLVIIEHVTVNRLDTLGFFGEPPWWAVAVWTLTLHGYLSSGLFLLGVATIDAFETRVILRGGTRFPAALGPRDVFTSLLGSPRLASLMQLARRFRYEAMRRSAILAVAQTCATTPDDDVAAAVKRYYDKAGITVGAPA